MSPKSQLLNQRRRNNWAQIYFRTRKHSWEVSTCSSCHFYGDFIAKLGPGLCTGLTIRLSWERAWKNLIVTDEKKLFPSAMLSSNLAKHKQKKVSSGDWLPPCSSSFSATTSHHLALLQALKKAPSNQMFAGKTTLTEYVCLLSTIEYLHIIVFSSSKLRKKKKKSK